MLKKPHKLRVVVLAVLLCMLGSLVGARLLTCKWSTATATPAAPTASRRCG